jgi:hypothetical protein
MHGAVRCTALTLNVTDKSVPEIAGGNLVEVDADCRCVTHKRRNGRDAAATVRLTVALSPEFPLATVQKRNTRTDARTLPTR